MYDCFQDLNEWCLEMAKLPVHVVGGSVSVDEFHQRGNDCYRAGNIQGALNEYEMACTGIRSSGGFRDKLACILSNMGQCYLKLGKYKKCLECVDESLKVHGEHISTKTLFRKAQALFGIGQYAEAQVQLIEIREALDANDVDTKRELDKFLNLCRERIEAQQDESKLKGQLRIVNEVPRWCMKTEESEFVPVAINGVPKSSPLIVPDKAASEIKIPAKRYVPKSVRMGLLKPN
jgi:tetratricopeptide (TPR) repeat protein